MASPAESQIFLGGCHCGNLTVSLATSVKPGVFEIRACQCSFCRKHNTLAIADRNGLLTLDVEESDNLSRYSFGLKTAEYLLCRKCGVYVAAVTIDEPKRALLVGNVLDARAQFDNTPLETNYDDESRERRVERRRTTWTPFQVRAAGS